MILTRTPLRISFVGGGTDMPEFYTKYGGAVVSMAINRYIYIMVNKKFEGGIRVSYSVTESVNEPEMLKHDIVRESLKSHGANGIEVVSVADIPAMGSGLGSSSSFAVGLTYALNKYFDWPINRHPAEMAERAYYVERELCGHPVGKQDHYAAAYGNLYYYRFNEDDTVATVPIQLDSERLKYLENRLMLFWLGSGRKADTILKDQAKRLESNEMVKENAIKMVEIAERLHADIVGGRVEKLGEYLDRNWQLKKKLSGNISNDTIDTYYKIATDAGAKGGKICGAGGSGFLLFYVEPDKQAKVKRALGLRQVHFGMSNYGSQLVCG